MTARDELAYLAARLAFGVRVEQDDVSYRVTVETPLGKVWALGGDPTMFAEDLFPPNADADARLALADSVHGFVLGMVKESLTKSPDAYLPVETAEAPR